MLIWPFLSINFELQPLHKLTSVELCSLVFELGEIMFVETNNTLR